MLEPAFLRIGPPFVDAYRTPWIGLSAAVRAVTEDIRGRHDDLDGRGWFRQSSRCTTANGKDIQPAGAMLYP